VHNPLSCDDTKATANAVSSLGAMVNYAEERWSVESDGTPRAPQDSIVCGESGVTLRFVIPIVALVGSDVKLKGNESLMRRPLQPLIETMQQLGVRISVEGVEVRVEAGSIKGGNIQISGNVSSQFISGLLLAGPLMEKGLQLRVTSTLESRGYVSLTIDALKRHGITVQTNREMSLFQIAPHQIYRPAEHHISGDYSSASFLISAAAVTGSKILITGLAQDESDPDSVFLNILAQMGGRSEFSPVGLIAQGGALHGTKVDVSNCPDLGPIIAVLGNFAEGQTEITGAGRLRYKESDRLEAISMELNRLGADIRETNEGLLVFGPTLLQGGTVESHSDHRIAMALAVAALKASGRVTIRDSQCVNKSYPRFFDDIRSLGVEAIER